MKKNTKLFLLASALFSIVACNKPVAHVHQFDDENDYMSIQHCQTCEYVGRKDPESNFIDQLEYNYDSKVKEEFDKNIEKAKSLLDSIENVSDTTSLKKASDSMENIFTYLDEEYDVIDNQCDAASLRRYVINDEEWNNKYDAVYADYQSCRTKYLNLLYLILNSNIKNYLYNEKEIEQIEKATRGYENEEMAELKTRINELEDKAYYDDYSSDSLFNQDAKELISLRNAVAQKYGYDNYYDYAYQEIYERKYGQDEVNFYRERVKNAISNYFDRVYLKLTKVYNTGASNYYNRYYYDVAIDSEKDFSFLVDYYKTMNSSKYNVNMFDVINSAFREGKVFFGEENGREGAFTSYMSNCEKFFYFASEEYYSSINTFVHEGGHYMVDSYSFPNNDFDILETHSQGNEALFLNYLVNNTTIEAHKTFLEYYFLYKTFDVVVESCIIDHIEECLYKNYCDLDFRLTDGISADEYSLLASTISSYYWGNGTLDSWKYYFTQSSCYEISYGISILPTIGLYYLSKTNKEAAMDAYFNTLYFYKDSDYDGNDSYEHVIKNAGLLSPFENELYSKIPGYLK